MERLPATEEPKVTPGSGEPADSDGALTRGRLQEFTAAERRERAHRRGRSTPSPEPDFHQYQSEDSPPPSRQPIPAEILAAAKEWDSFCRENEPDYEAADREALERRQAFLRQFYGSSQWDSEQGCPKPSTPSDPARGDAADGDSDGDGRQHAHPDILYSRPDIPRQQHAASPSTSEPRFPPNFPAYHCTQNMNEIAAYLANASYVAALGGPPLGDLKYGIIVVPVGEESLLFGRPPNFVMGQDFLDAVDDANRDYERALRMHDPDKDSEEFVRNRFDGDFASVPVEEHRNVEVIESKEDQIRGNGEVQGSG